MVVFSFALVVSICWQEFYVDTCVVDGMF